MKRERANPVAPAIALAALVSVVVAGTDAGALVREPVTVTRCLCVGGASVEWTEGSTLGPPGRGRLDWPGASALLRCRPEPLPAGAPGEKVRLVEE